MLVCLICSKDLKQLHQHIVKKHSMTPAEYRSAYGYTGKMQYVSDFDKQKRSKAAKSGGSILNIEYWIKRGYSIEDAKAEISKIQLNNSSKRKYKPNERIINIEYWMQRYGYSEEDAKSKVSELQASRSAKSSKFSGKTHSNESKKSIAINMSKHVKNIGAKDWVSHFGKFSGSSKSEIECYNEIKRTICNDIQANVNIAKYVVDMQYKHYIIEFNGDYWHSNPLMFNDDFYNKTLKKYAREIRQNDLIRQNELHILGYNVLVVWEYDWKHNKLLVLEQIKKFLNDV